MDFLLSFPLLQTSRLNLRQMNLSDAKDLYSYNSDPHVTKFLNWDGFVSVENAEEFINSWNNAFEEKRLIPWGISLRTNRKLIGTVMLMPLRGTFENQPLFPLTIGFDLNHEFWNNGIMSEALQAVITFARDIIGSHRIQAEVIPGNEASRVLLKKQGFKEEGLLRKYSMHEVSKEFLDVVMLALVNEN